MEEQRDLTIHFVDGTTLSLQFPAQGIDPNTAAKRLDDLLKNQYLTVEVEGSLMLFPLGSIKYVRASPAPAKLPPNVIQGAKVKRSPAKKA